MALASGVSLAATGGDRATAASLLRAGCRGTFFIMGLTAGCATMRGMGEDVQSLGRGIKKVFTQ